MAQVKLSIEGMYQEETGKNVFYYPKGISLEEATKLKEHLDLDVIKGKIKIKYQPN